MSIFFNHSIIRRCRPIVWIIDSIAAQINVITQSKHHEVRTLSVFLEEQFDYWRSFASVMIIPKSLLLYVTIFIKLCLWKCRTFLLKRESLSRSMRHRVVATTVCLSVAFHSGRCDYCIFEPSKKLVICASCVCAVIWCSISMCNLQIAKWHVTNSMEHNHTREATCCLASEWISRSLLSFSKWMNLPPSIEPTAR